MCVDLLDQFVMSNVIGFVLQTRLVLVLRKSI